MSSHQRQEQEARFKSEIFVPVKRDQQSYAERQKDIWREMNDRMERRRKEWDDDVTKLRKDFFRLKPDDMTGGGVATENLLEKMDLQGMFYDVKDGTKVFRVSFDVSQFSPDEISVKTQDNKLIVQAKHEEKTGDDKTVSREFSRQVDIPSNVDPLQLQSTLSKDGILQVEAPVSIPDYNTVKQTSGQSTSRTTTHPVVFSTSNFTGPTSFDQGSYFSEQDGSKVFRIAIDIGYEFVPQDLTVKTVDRKLTVHAKHEEKTPGRTSCKEFNREFDLPDSVDPNLVTASLTAEGRLILEAPISSYSQGVYSGKPGSTKQPNITLEFSK